MLSVCTRLRAFDLIVARSAGHLPARVEQHSRAGGADRMTAPDQSAADGLTGMRPPFSMSPASTACQLSPGRGDAEMVDRHVLGGGEAIVRFDAVDR